jgi:hypothetical protein
MANEVKYQNQVWGEPITGERLSTNGHYTGEHIGSVTQDAKTSMTAHMVEDGIVRLGTMTQDAIEGSTPVVAVG